MNLTTKEGIDRFAKHGSRPGDFLFAVLSNDLVLSFSRATPQNKRDMLATVSYCCNNVPAEAWGSPEKVTAWMNKKQKEREETAAKKTQTLHHVTDCTLIGSDYVTICKDGEEYQVNTDEFFCPICGEPLIWTGG